MWHLSPPLLEGQVKQGKKGLASAGSCSPVPEDTVAVLVQETLVSGTVNFSWLSPTACEKHGHLSVFPRIAIESAHLVSLGLHRSSHLCCHNG